jgi:hypothetical protein
MELMWHVFSLFLKVEREARRLSNKLPDKFLAERYC